jgi:dTDP-4-dehydrorhamnose 3,5-epimerase
MKFIPTDLPGVLICEPTVFGDERGWFYESWNAQRFAAAGLPTVFVQDNHSRSARGILRGLHYQVRNTQDKLVRCTFGVIFDVAVDVRRGSPTFGKWVGVELSERNKRQLWVPKGFAHGFLTVSDLAEVQYKVTDYWSKDAERGLRWDDPGVGIAWPEVGVKPQLNQRDATFPVLAAAPVADLLTWQG